MIKQRLFSQLSSPLLLVVITMMGAGLVQVYSSSYIFATESYGDGLFFFKRQSGFVLLGLFILLMTSVAPIKWIQKYSILIWILGIAAVALTFVPGLSVRAGGAARWIQGPMGFRFEPSEFLKFAFPLLIAAFAAKEKKQWPFILTVIILPLIIILRQPDFGSFAIIVLVGFGLIFSLGLKWRYIFASCAVALPAFYFLVMRVDYRRARILSFLDPWADPAQKGFQVIQSMLSFHSGGFFGVGIGEGQGKLFFLPEAHTDFTLAVLGEEYGFLGFFVIMMMYGYIVYRGFQIAVKADSIFHRIAALGISMTFALSVFINTGVVMGLLPTKGLTLPFLSYGGSSLVVLCFIFGVLLNIENSLNENHQKSFLKTKTKLS